MLAEGYTRAELFDLWRTFKTMPDAVQRLADFAVIDKGAAALMHMSFWREYRESYGSAEPEQPPQFPKAKIKPSDWMW